MAGSGTEHSEVAEIADLGMEIAFTYGTAWVPPQRVVDAANEAAGALDLVLLSAWRTFGPYAWRRIRTSSPDLADLGDPVAATCSCPTVCNCGTVIRLKKNTSTPPAPAAVVSEIVDFLRAWMVLVPVNGGSNAHG
jgi:hypothetical protein